MFYIYISIYVYISLSIAILCKETKKKIKCSREISFY